MEISAALKQFNSRLDAAQNSAQNASGLTTALKDAQEKLSQIAVRKPKWILTYEKKDISAQLAPYVLSITYTDYLQGQSDELDINLEDRDERWKKGWYPQKGDEIFCGLGYVGETLLPCGTFQLDEIEMNGPPDTVSLRCLAAPVTKALRTNNTVAYENKTLREIAGDIAKTHGLTIIGTVPDIRVERITQNSERDLSFLRRLAMEYGCVFSARGDTLIWHEHSLLDNVGATANIDKKQMTSYTFRSKSSQTFKGCLVKYFNARKKKEISHTVMIKGMTDGDILKIVERCENKTQAEAKANAAIRNANGKMIQGDITMSGDQRLVAGVNIAVTGLGVIDGTYQAIKSRHTMTRGGGYTTSLELTNTTATVKTMQNLKNEKKLTKRAK